MGQFRINIGLVLLLVLLIAQPGIHSAAGAGTSPLSLELNSTGASRDALSGVLEMRIDLSALGLSAADVQDTSKMLMVEGTGSDLADRLVADEARIALPQLGNATRMSDTPAAVQAAESGKYSVVLLIGGEGANAVTKHFSDKGTFTKKQEFYSWIQVESGKQGSVLVVSASHLKSAENFQRASVKYSPLSAFLPPELVPPAATGISIVLLALISVAQTIFAFKALHIGRKGKKVGEHAWKIAGIGIGEAFALIAASVVLGVSISWQYLGPSGGFFYWVAINTGICALAGILHEVAHRLAAHFFRVKVEYRFWPAGSALTLLSSYLGNAFAVQGFLLEQIDEKLPKWKLGVRRLAGPIVSYVTMVAFAALNLFHPTKYFQVISATSALWAVAEVFPFNGLDGKDLKAWNSAAWLLIFLLFCATYAIVTFML